MKKFFSVFPLILFVIVQVLIISGKIPSRFFSLSVGIIFLWGFLQYLWKLRKNPKEKLRWFDLIFYPLTSLLYFYVFWLQISK